MTSCGTITIVDHDSPNGGGSSDPEGGAEVVGISSNRTSESTITTTYIVENDSQDALGVEVEVTMDGSVETTHYHEIESGEDSQAAHQSDAIPGEHEFCVSVTDAEVI